MSYVKSNFDVFVKENVREFEDSEVETMTVSEFDALPLSDQISIFNRFPDQYNRLSGRTADDTAPGKGDDRSDAERFADEFEQVVDRALQRAFHGENQ